MSRERVVLSGVAETLMITLYLRACDARSAHPVLGDPYAADLVERIDHDFTVMARGRANAPVVAARAAQLDRWTQQFLDSHPDGQVLHLGCGLDSRPLRLHRPAASRWVDVDQPPVVEVRRRLYDLPPEIVTIGASVTDPDWWDRVDTERPTILVAEGLLMYLPDHEVHALLDRATALLGHGEVVFDGVAPWMVTLTRRVALLRRAQVRFRWALDDLTPRHPGLRRVDRASVIDLLAHSDLPAPARAAYRLLARIPPMRRALRLEHLAVRPVGNHGHTVSR